MSLTKRPVDHSGEELRHTVRFGREPSRGEALRELERRRDNLRDAVIPDWELEARGQDPEQWDLTR